MVLARKDDSMNSSSMYYKETATPLRETRFFLKPVQVGSLKGEKRNDAVNVQVVKGKTTTFIHLDDEEAKKVQVHGDAVLKRLQQVHKSVIWNFFVGRASLDAIQKHKSSEAGGAQETNIDKDENLDFDPLNPRSWSEESLNLIRCYLKALQFSCDGFVVLFCVKNEDPTGDVDYDEMAWELEKCLTYHYIAQKHGKKIEHGKSQLIMNEEATMARRGLDPVSRKSKTIGRKKAGFCVFLAYQIFDNVTHDQMVGEALNKYIDIDVKKKQLLHALTESKLQPQVDEKIRKTIKGLREFMSQDRLEIVSKLKELQDPQCIEMLTQFMQYLMQNQQGNPGGSNKRTPKNSSFVGLPQFIAFLNKSNESGTVGSSTNSPRPGTREINSPRVRGGGGEGSSTGTYTALPRPKNSSTSMSKRKSSFSSQLTDGRLSSQSMTPPETPRSGSGSKMISSLDSRHRDTRAESSLASIPSSGHSGSSTPDTLQTADSISIMTEEGKEESASERENGERHSKMINSTSKLPKRTQSLRDSANGHPRSSSRPERSSAGTHRPSPGQLGGVRDTTSLSPRTREFRQEARSATSSSPRVSEGSKRVRANHRAGSATSSIASSSGGGKDSPSRSITSRSSHSRRTPTPLDGPMITREDLRRMNRSTPASTKKKEAASYSRAAITMS